MSTPFIYSYVLGVLMGRKNAIRSGESSALYYRMIVIRE